MTHEQRQHAINILLETNWSRMMGNHSDQDRRSILDGIMYALKSLRGDYQLALNIAEDEFIILNAQGSSERFKKSEYLETPIPQGTKCVPLDATTDPDRQNRIGKTIRLVEEWAQARGIDKVDPAKQMLKLTEETGELAAAIARDNTEEAIDAVGDIMVVLTILCQQTGISLTGAFESAYQTIKIRTGKTVKGVFVKEEDLQ